MTYLTRDSEFGIKLARSQVIAVLVIDELAHAVPVAKSLLAGGIDVMELTLRTPVAIEALRLIREEVPDMIAGIGTILSREQVDQVMEAGAHFGVAPSVNPEVIRHAVSSGLPFSPGIMTPTDIDMALAQGCRILKYFPAESSGGLDHLKNIAAPFLHLDIGFIPLGGLNSVNMATYLSNDLITAIGGSWLAPRQMILEEQWDQIRENALHAIALRGPVRS